jgi:L-lactate dehydrogenase complex protein LldG
MRAESTGVTTSHADPREIILSSVKFANRSVDTSNLVSRDYRRPARSTVPDVLEHFAERVGDYQAVVSVTTPANLSAAISAALAARGSTSVVTAHGAPSEWLSLFEGHAVVDDGTLEMSKINGADAVVTGCTAGIAETGTVVLNSEPNEGRRIITLLPDHHVVVIREDQIVPDVPDVIHLLDPLRPQTWISGPSATSDIELSRVEGVHGPRKLDVIIVRA